MLGNIVKACQVLNREGMSGAVNRLRYRRDKLLMQERCTQLNPMFTLEGDGVLRQQFHAELSRRNLMAPAYEPTPQRILLNPIPLGFRKEGIRALVFEDAYLNDIFSSNQEFYKALVAEHPLVVTSEAGLRRIVELGAPLRNIMLVPIDSPGAAFRLAVGRWLAYIGAIRPEDYLDDLLASGAPIYDRSRVCISLPEHQHRRAGFLESGQLGYVMFDGIRLLPGWKGAAWSYKAIATKALQSDAQRITICEDDAILGPDFKRIFNAVNRYLDQIDWDVFNGVMTRLPRRPEITMEGKFGQNHIFHAKHMMGMVFNIYNRTALEWLANWDPASGGPEKNTVDEWLNTMPNLKVVSAVPFIAGHREDAHSTIFGFKNTRYNTMIQATERKLLSLSKLG